MENSWSWTIPGKFCGTFAGQEALNQFTCLHFFAFWLFGKLLLLFLNLVISRICASRVKRPVHPANFLNRSHFVVMVQIFLTFLKLGLTSFGGPIAHLSFFHHEFVTKKHWLSDHEYANLVALCQFLPGPASSQIGIAIGFYRGGILGSLCAWIAFTLPSAILLVLFAMSVSSLSNVIGDSWIHGLKIAAVAVVAQAVWEMAKKFSSSSAKMLITLLTVLGCFFIQGAWAQVILIAAGAVTGMLFLGAPVAVPHQPKEFKYRLSSVFLCLFFILLIMLPLLAVSFNSIEIRLAYLFYRVGALVFGGGHVVLPLIQSSVVESGLVSKETFLAGYGAAQAVPGPLFSLSAYLGFACDQWKGAIISLIMIFLPSFLLIIGVLPYWEKIRSYTKMKTALVGVNAVVVGLLLVALYDPVWRTAIFSWTDVLLASGAFFILLFKIAPNYAVVAGLALITALPFY